VILGYRGDTTSDAYEAMKREVLDALRQHFRPEFLNRVDEIVVFHSLSRAELKQIVDIQLTRLRQRLVERKIELELTDAAKEHFANAGYDPVYGARPLKRLLQKEIETTLGRKILAGEVPEGSRVLVDFDGRELAIPAAPSTTAAA
jgi:ATP-dependent Clp protease ATP-binding subunit ClpB